MQVTSAIKKIYHQENKSRMASERRHQHPRRMGKSQHWRQREIYTNRVQRETLKNWIKITIIYIDYIVNSRSPPITAISKLKRNKKPPHVQILQSEQLNHQANKWIYEIFTNTHQAALGWTRHPTDREEEAVWQTSRSMDVFSCGVHRPVCQQPCESLLGYFLPTETERTRGCE